MMHIDVMVMVAWKKKLRDK